MRYFLLAAFLSSLLIAESPVRAQDAPLVRWEKTGEIAAPEATQAAAADERFVFAIANRVIGKYDRGTGERVALSTGDAHHLNSGFLHEGQLYCAHSNFPRQPERSEILRLDPKSMELTTFKEFGDFGGSLTWCIRRDGHWWCNFAKYKSDNAKTFLVEFDDQWKELARWTYPPELIAKLGTYSLSGGIWRGDELLVTDHDHGRLYVVRLPREGTVLNFVGQQPAPFTGQGIAADPKTGGLVGINRGKLKVIFAQEPERNDASEKGE
jgi:hypothetical protein